jgi:5,10-methylenetetrahydromethanopterin reductase
MLYGPGQGPERPIEVPMLFATGGPKSEALAHELFDGVFTVVPRPDFPRSAMIALGTVLDESETFDSPRVIEAAGSGCAVLFHAGYEHALLAASTRHPEREDWRAAVERMPADERHLHTHIGHLTYLNDTDRQVMNGSLIEQLTFSGNSEALRNRLDEVAGAA